MLLASWQPFSLAQRNPCIPKFCITNFSFILLTLICIFYSDLAYFVLDSVVNIGATAIVTDAATAMFGEAGVSAATGVMTVCPLSHAGLL